MFRRFAQANAVKLKEERIMAKILLQMQNNTMENLTFSYHKKDYRVPGGIVTSDQVEGEQTITVALTRSPRNIKASSTVPNSNCRVMCNVSGDNLQLDIRPT